MFGSRWQMSNIFFIEGFPLIINNQLFFIFTFPGKATRHQIINQNSQRKRIAFCRVEPISKRFYRHIEWTSNQILILKYLIILKAICKTKIAQLESTVFDQNIGRLDVSMHYAVLSEIGASETDFIRSFCPIEFYFVVNEGL